MLGLNPFRWNYTLNSLSTNNLFYGALLIFPWMDSSPYQTWCHDVHRILVLKAPLPQELRFREANHHYKSTCEWQWRWIFFLLIFFFIRTTNRTWKQNNIRNERHSWKMMPGRWWQEPHHIRKPGKANTPSCIFTSFFLGWRRRRRFRFPAKSTTERSFYLNASRRTKFI